MKKVSALLLLVVALCFCYSCKHEPILPIKQVSYHDDVLPIIRSSCQHAGCHNPTDPNNEFPLDSIVSQLVDEYVEPGNPGDSDIYERITETDPDKIMPKPPYQPLTERQIELIYVWIAQGAKDN